MFHMHASLRSHCSFALVSLLLALAAGCGDDSSSNSADAGGTGSDAGNRDDAGGSDSSVATSMDGG
jgi:hypothetical protein